MASAAWRVSCSGELRVLSPGRRQGCRLTWGAAIEWELKVSALPQAQQRAGPRVPSRAGENPGGSCSCSLSPRAEGG